MTSPEALWALFAILVVQAVTDVAVLMLGRREAALLRSLPYLVSAAAGVLLATACLDLLPEALRTGGRTSGVWNVFLSSLLGLFCLQALGSDTGETFSPEHEARGEAATRIRLSEASSDLYLHGHTHAGSRTRSTVPLLFGSALHSAVDGLAIAAAFSAGRGAGWSAAAAVALHELPHRLGDFSLLLHRGKPRRDAALFAIGAGMMAFVGGLVVLAFGHYAQATRWLLPVSAASFLYIALVDLVPELQSHRRTGRMWWEIACLLGGAALIAVVIHLPGE